MLNKTEVHQVACSLCGAPVDSPCRTDAGRGKPTRPHAIRKRALGLHRAQVVADEWNAAHPVGTRVLVDLGPASSYTDARHTVHTATTDRAWVRQDSMAPVVRVADLDHLVALRFVTAV